MSDDLRTRIAKVLHRQYGPSLGAAEGGWDRETAATQETYCADADAVIAELGLWQQWSNWHPGYYRWVTDWRVNEPTPPSQSSQQ
jgi:hypothetical protein